MKPARKLSRIGDYYFARKREEIARMEKDGEKFISLAIGNPDLPPPPEVVDELTARLGDPGAHRYQAYSGLPSFKEAIARFYRRHFGVSPDPATAILPLMGSKSGIMWLSLAYLDPGDKVLVPEPGYMAYGSVTILAGGEPVAFELEPARRWQPDLDRLTPLADEAKIMWMNYTNMPTGTPADRGFLKELVSFAKDKDIILAFDNPYSLITDQAASILKFSEDAPVVEFQSMSKNFNMAGWRLGWMAGHPEIIRATAKVQNNAESGIFYPLQKAAEVALDLSDEWFEQINRIYARRKEKVKKLASRFGGTCSTEGGGMFCWIHLPEGMSGERLADEWFYKYRIFIAPGTIFGKKWDNYVRISLTVPDDLYDEALRRLDTWTS
ncbi:MAG: aminotransferase class I/II-fold pyridoxal phosphate-dependent enzyme [Chlorobi bacterium]|nr:aminotransferase class I/II-fold pyridoxal phosphate-dependent enzyme [Chlorobiota bacterium]